jgi:hypothetical protein
MDVEPLNRVDGRFLNVRILIKISSRSHQGQHNLSEREDLDMNNMVPINSKKFLGAYSDAQNSERIPDEAVFFTGVIFFVVLPQIINIVYGGFIPLVVFAGSALVGSILGLVMYNRFPYRMPTCLRSGNVPQAPPSEGVAKKKAA